MKKRWKVIAIAGTALVIALAVTGVVLAQSSWSDGSSPTAVAQGPGTGQGLGNTEDQGAGRGQGYRTSETTHTNPAEHSTVVSAAAGTLTQEVADALLFLREEEKLARDVYLKLYETWGQNTFANIAASETRHMDSVKTLLDAYGLNDPVGTNAPGVFTDPELQQAYDTLVAQGASSLEEALKVGVTIENLDIEDLQELLALSPSADVAEVAQNLLQGSKNHLKAFTSVLDR